MMNNYYKDRRFPIKFTDALLGDWDVVLYTSRPTDYDYVQEVVERYYEICLQEESPFSPVAVMDRIVDGFDGWYWEDDDEVIEIVWR